MGRHSERCVTEVASELMGRMLDEWAERTGLGDHAPVERATLIAVDELRSGGSLLTAVAAGRGFLRSWSHHPSSRVGVPRGDGGLLLAAARVA
jgi:hypothetical protein